MRNHRVISQNIRGTPSMGFFKVRHDLKVVRTKEPTVLCLQEMKFKWYWVALLIVFRPTRWGVFPRFYRGAKSSQPILWDRKRWKKITTKQVLLHEGKAADPHGWEDRFINAVLLEDRETARRAWFTNRHYLPAAWRTPHGSLRRHVWAEANDRDRQFLTMLERTGDPIFALGDYNWPGKVYGDVLAGHRVDYHGWEEPIDKVISIGRQVKEVWTGVIPVRDLYTDHGGRILIFLLRKT